MKRTASKKYGFRLTINGEKARKIRLSRIKDGRTTTQTQFWSPIGVAQAIGSRYELGGSMPDTVLILLEISHGSNPLEVVANLRGTTVADLIAAGK